MDSLDLYQMCKKFISPNTNEKVNLMRDPINKPSKKYQMLAYQT